MLTEKVYELATELGHEIGKEQCPCCHDAAIVASITTLILHSAYKLDHLDDAKQLLQEISTELDATNIELGKNEHNELLDRIVAKMKEYRPKEPVPEVAMNRAQRRARKN